MHRRQCSLQFHYITVQVFSIYSSVYLFDDDDIGVLISLSRRSIKVVPFMCVVRQGSSPHRFNLF